MKDYWNYSLPKYKIKYLIIFMYEGYFEIVSKTTFIRIFIGFSIISIILEDILMPLIFLSIELLYI